MSVSTKRKKLKPSDEARYRAKLEKDMAHELEMKMALVEARRKHKLAVIVTRATLKKLYTNLTSTK